MGCHVLAGLVHAVDEDRPLEVGVGDRRARIDQRQPDRVAQPIDQRVGVDVVAVALLWRLESLPRGAKISLLCGITLQTAYLVTDHGDGEFFQLPIAEPVLKWVEEILELLAMQAYLVAIVLIVVTTLAPLVNLSTAAYPKRSEADELPV